LRIALTSVLGVLLVALGAAPAARSAEIREIEAVGAVPLGDGNAAAGAPRDAALRRALSDAVERVALDLLPELDPEEAPAVLARVLGDDPLAYANRFRILEDRGERAAIFAEDPDVETEYVVVVKVNVDVARVRKRLEMTGLLEPSRSRGRVRVNVVMEDLESFGAYEAVRQLLVEDVGVRSALPVEMTPGRAVVEVDGDRRPGALLQALMEAAPPTLRITPVSTDRGTVTVRVSLTPGPAGPGEETPSDAHAIDTKRRNRY
jgi:hypothetical protein